MCILYAALWRWNCICECPLLGDTCVSSLVVQVLASWSCRNRCCRFTASLAGCWVVISWYLSRGVVMRSEVILRRLSEIALKRAGYDFWILAPSCLRKSNGDWLVTDISYVESVAVIGWIQCWLLAAGRWCPVPLFIHASHQAEFDLKSFL